MHGLETETSRLCIQGTLTLRFSYFYFVIAPIIIFLQSGRRHSRPSSSQGVWKGLINIDDSPLRVKNHWHTGRGGPAWYYADSRARGIYPEGRGWLGGAAVLAFVHAPFHQLAGQERQTEESNSIPAPVPTAPPSAQRSWTDQPECGEQCYLNSSLSSYAVLDGATLKVSSVKYIYIYIYIVYIMFLLPQAVS